MTVHFKVPGDLSEVLREVREDSVDKGVMGSDKGGVSCG